MHQGCLKSKQPPLLVRPSAFATSSAKPLMIAKSDNDKSQFWLVLKVRSIIRWKLAPKRCTFSATLLLLCERRSSESRHGLCKKGQAQRMRVSVASTLRSSAKVRPPPLPPASTAANRPLRNIELPTCHFGKPALVCKWQQQSVFQGQPRPFTSKIVGRGAFIVKPLVPCSLLPLVQRRQADFFPMFAMIKREPAFFFIRTAKQRPTDFKNQYFRQCNRQKAQKLNTKQILTRKTGKYCIF